ncbi:MAG: hypothetical protein O2911_08535 [Bacteroidetes bacterium]|nr:hypothetical protein [Bacteroidota bacterium]
MYKLVSLLFLTPSLLFGQVLIENFEDERHLSYAEKSGEFESDNPNEGPALMGGMYWGVANPDMTGTNSSSRCGKYMRNVVETYDYFVAIPAGGFDNLNDFTDGSNFFTLDVWSPEENTSFILSFENREIALIDPDSTDGVHSRFEATSTIANAWHTITFSFLDFPDLNITVDQIDQMVLLVNSGQLGSDVQIYFDNLYGPDFGCMDTDPNEVIDDFECQRNHKYSFTHGALDFVTNPDQSGINNSDKCGLYTSGGSGDENGNVINLLSFDPPLDMTNHNAISIKVKSSFSKNVQLTLEDGVNSYTQEVMTSGNNIWSELIFDFSDINSTSFSQAILIFAPGETEAGYTFYYDDITKSQITDIENNKLIENIFTINNFIYFSEINSGKQIRIYDVNGKLLADEFCIDQKYELKHKGLLMISISDTKGNITSIKHLNL